jgi:hypothetical protein
MSRCAKEEASQILQGFFLKYYSSGEFRVACAHWACGVVHGACGCSFFLRGVGDDYVGPTSARERYMLLLRYPFPHAA